MMIQKAAIFELQFDNWFIIWRLFLHHCQLQLKNIKNSKLFHHTLKSRTLENWVHFFSHKNLVPRPEESYFCPKNSPLPLLLNSYNFIQIGSKSILLLWGPNRIGILCDTQCSKIRKMCNLEKSTICFFSRTNSENSP